MRAAPHIAALHADLLAQAQEKVAAIDPNLLKMLGVGAGGLALGGVGAHLLTRSADEEERRKTRNKSFGAGAAAGLAVPHIAKGVFNIAQGQGWIPGGAG